MKVDSYLLNQYAIEALLILYNIQPCSPIVMGNAWQTTTEETFLLIGSLFFRLSMWQATYFRYLLLFFWWAMLIWDIIVFALRLVWDMYKKCENWLVSPKSICNRSVAYIIQGTTLLAHSYGICLTDDDRGDVSINKLVNFFGFPCDGQYIFCFSFDGQDSFETLLYLLFVWLVTDIKSLEVDSYPLNQHTIEALLI